jgi:hypothetical protein
MERAEIEASEAKFAVTCSAGARLERSGTGKSLHTSIDQTDRRTANHGHLRQVPARDGDRSLVAHRRKALPDHIHLAHELVLDGEQDDGEQEVIIAQGVQRFEAGRPRGTDGGTD